MSIIPLLRTSSIFSPFEFSLWIGLKFLGNLSLFPLLSGPVPKFNFISSSFSEIVTPNQEKLSQENKEEKFKFSSENDGHKRKKNINNKLFEINKRNNIRDLETIGDNFNLDSKNKAIENDDDLEGDVVMQNNIMYK